ncbi:hypothetical protein FHU36_008443 [Nonomuraea muscovyensis]|uniref:Secreted protein n=1 Tax=Nonomuraea muscovyensis TaxID=1124761 RepID=A0A7X0F371_9ACTN|nr:hypothetical protein [Nonomuraea muscovyensis]MBB6351860.1 hypothetical protein [Nonomuraea muscovyensis]
MKLLLMLPALALTTGLASSSCGDLPHASTDDPSGIVMGRRGDDELMVGPRDGSPAFIRKATRVQIKACTREPDLMYPACLP